MEIACNSLLKYYTEQSLNWIHTGFVCRMIPRSPDMPQATTILVYASITNNARQAKAYYKGNYTHHNNHVFYNSAGGDCVLLY